MDLRSLIIHLLFAADCNSHLDESGKGNFEFLEEFAADCDLRTVSLSV